MPSESQYIGSMVSIDCGELGAYQGRVEKIDPVLNTLTITHAFHNGLRCDMPEVNLSSTTIIDIKIIHASHEAKEIITRKATPSKMTKEIDEVTKPTCSSPVKIIKATSKARTGFNSAIMTGSGVNHLDLASGKSSCRRRLSPPDSPSKFHDSGTNPVGQQPRASKSMNIEQEMMDQGNGHGGDNIGKLRDGSGYLTDYNGRKITVEKRVERGRKGANTKNIECFSAPTDSFLQDFDFESNLALFNKKAVFREIENGFPDLNLDSFSGEPKYRHDENILQPGENNLAPAVMKQQIQVPGPKFQLYYTDTGLVVPSVSLELREKVCEAASRYGLSCARQLESFGRAASEMVIHLIGGSHRIHPKNGHQLPVVVILCGPHEQGALGACCARILSSHGVQVTLVMPKSSTNMSSSLTQEVELCKLTGNILVQGAGALPKTIDLIVTAMDSHISPSSSQQPWYQSIMSCMKSSDIRAQVLALDPPPEGPSIPAKWSLCKVLPLNQVSSKCGSLYLCDLSIPPAIFQKSGITYVSPFGSKFVIPLHVKE